MQSKEWAGLECIELCTGVSKRKLARWCVKGKLPARRGTPRGRWYVNIVKCVESLDAGVSDIGLVTLAHLGQIESVTSDRNGVTVVVKCSI